MLSVRTVWMRFRKTSGAPASRLPFYVVLLLFYISGPRVGSVPGEDHRGTGRRFGDTRGRGVDRVERPGGRETREVLAKIDTGAGYSSIDRDLAEDLGADLEDPEDEVEIESANGEEERPLVRVRIRMAGKTLDTRVTVTDRSELSKDVLIGSRDLDGFLIEPNAERLTSPSGSRRP